MRVALVTVGDEILSGDTVNTNAAWLGERLTASGADVERLTVIPDRVAEIARVVNEYRAEYDAVIVTGGLVAAAFGTEVAPDQEAERWLAEEAGYSGDDLAPETTAIPEEATFLRNPDGVAPGCTIGNVYVLPGLPAEMKAMFELIADEFGGDVRHVATVETPEPESELLDRIEELRERFGVIVGSYPGEHVRLKIEGYDEDTVTEAAAWLKANVEAPDDA
ncbi:competence/damage-inducible protein A [Halobacteriales archaeon QH_7_66_37]|nr:MAG: competence/damage-inducible protein A [Halobacteriales archaeon QH_7_66_37]